MRRGSKRVLALLMLLALLMSLTMPALAEEPEELPQEETAAEESPETPETEPAEEPAPAEESAPAEEPGEEEAADVLRELYVSAQGDDEKGDGSVSAPFKSLARAAEAANLTPEEPVFILLLTDLEAKACARFTGRDVTIQAMGKQLTVKRAAGFAPAKDGEGAAYNPAMIELAAPEDSELPAGSLTLIGVILDDGLLHEGSLAEEPAAENEAEAPETAEALPGEEAPETAEAAEAMSAPAAEETDAEEATEAEKEEALEADTEESAEAPEETGSEGPEGAAASDRLDQAQEAIISVGDGGCLILSTGAELRNFGGRSAVSLGENSILVLEPASAIRDTEKAENTLPAILQQEGARVESMEGAQILERKAEETLAALSTPAQPQAEEGEEEEAGGTELSFTAPETITRLVDSTILQYPVDYTLRFTMSEQLAGLIRSAQSMGAEAQVSGSIVLKLDARLQADLSSCKLESSLFELDGEPTLEGTTLTAKIKTKDGWADRLEELDKPMRFTCSTNLSALDFRESTAEKDEFLISTALVSLEGEVSGKLVGPYNTQEREARTKMLGLGNATIIYDPNGGQGGPGVEMGVSPQKDYKLKTQPKPTHEAVEGTPVVFLGWSETRIEKIYARGEEKPELVSSIVVPGIEELGDLIDNSVTVYAVYSYDMNGDGIADVDQVLAILSFDPNGGVNEPDPIIHVVGSTAGGELGVEIPQQEPNRDYFYFLGWGESADATKNDKLYKFDSDKAGRRDIPVTKDKTLYAVWEKNYQINYDANGGTDAPAPTVLLTMTKTYTDRQGNPAYGGRAYITDQVPTRSGYKFQGWAVSRSSAAAYFAGDQVEISAGNVTLYAVWTRQGIAGGGGSMAPRTGDSDPGLWMALLGASALGLGCVGGLLWRKRRA